MARLVAFFAASLISFSLATAAEPQRLRVNAFPSAKALPLHAGVAKGIFARRDIAIELSFTENSIQQREGLAAGTIDIALAAVDNAVAMVEVAGQDVVIVTGGDGGMNEFFVQPYVRSFGDLRGRTLVVDAPDTAYALLAKKILLKHGLAAVDNAVAMVEVARQDVVIVTGGDSGMNEFFVQPYVRSFVDLRGRILVVDAPDTAYALLAKKILLKHGLTEGRDYVVKPVGRGELRLKAMASDKENAAAILNLPFTIQAEQLGLKSLGSTVDMLGPYQANGAFVQRAWAKANSALLERFIAAYVESLRWSLQTGNRDEAVGLLMERLKLSRDIAERTWHLLADPARGFTPDARFDRKGFDNMLALRAEMEGGRAPAAPEKYFDLSYYERALSRLSR